MLELDLRIFNDEALDRAMAKLAGVQQRSIMQSALRNSGKRLWPYLVYAASGGVLKKRTGKLAAAVAAMKPKAAKVDRDTFGIMYPYPERDALGITNKSYADADPGKVLVNTGRVTKTGKPVMRWRNRKKRVKVGYYPAILEYGHKKMPAKRWIRKTVNNRMGVELDEIHNEILGKVREALTIHEPSLAA